MGVVFSEIAKHGQVASIRCHGPKSIYEYAVDNFIAR